jgi:hypothetical protein
VELPIAPGRAQIPALELDRMTDDGGPVAHAVAPAHSHLNAEHLNGTALGLAAGTGTCINEWFRELGVSHRRRNQLAAQDTYVCQNRHLERQIALRQHWPGIVASMRTLSHSYNEGAGLDVLTIAEAANGDGGDPLVEIVARGGQTLTMTLVDAELCVRQSPAISGALDAGRRWLVLGASDQATAAYALQHWLTQL